MDKTELRIVTMAKASVSRCPYCGGNPRVEVTIDRAEGRNDIISVQEVICRCCDLRAPIEAWEAIADKFEKSICREEEEKRQNDRK